MGGVLSDCMQDGTGLLMESIKNSPMRNKQPDIMCWDNKKWGDNGLSSNKCSAWNIVLYVIKEEDELKEIDSPLKQ